MGELEAWVIARVMGPAPVHPCSNFATVSLNSFWVDIDDDALTAEPECRFSHKFRICHGGRVDRDLVATGTEQHANVFQSPDASANSQRHKTDF